MGDGRRRQRVVNAVAAQRRDLDASRPSRRQAQVEGHALRAARLDLSRPYVGALLEAVAQHIHALWGQGRHPRNALVVRIEHGRAGRRQCLHELALAALNLVDRAGARQVGATHRGHDPDAGPSQRGQLGDIARYVHAHLQHGCLVTLIEAQQGQRQADLVVLVGRVAQHFPALGENFRNLLLG